MTAARRSFISPNPQSWVPSLAPNEHGESSPYANTTVYVDDHHAELDVYGDGHDDTCDLPSCPDRLASCDLPGCVALATQQVVLDEPVPTHTIKIAIVNHARATEWFDTTPHLNSSLVALTLVVLAHEVKLAIFGHCHVAFASCARRKPSGISRGRTGGTGSARRIANNASTTAT